MDERGRDKKAGDNVEGLAIEKRQEKKSELKGGKGVREGRVKSDGKGEREGEGGVKVRVKGRARKG